MEEMTPELMNELEYLRWFYAVCDFGPAHEDVIYLLNEKWVEEGNVVPDGYKED